MSTSFPGGLRLVPHKLESTAHAIEPGPRPARLVLTLVQHAGAPARPIVAIGDAVRRGDCIAAADDGHGVALHASAAGRVVAIGPHPAPSGDECIVLDVAADEQEVRLAPLDPLACTPAELLARVREAGVAGLGGAGFATAAKLDRRVATLVVNGAECEPYIACDDSLLRERAPDVLRGAWLMARITGASRIVLAVEDAMREAVAACRRALAECAREPLAGASPPIELAIVPTVYPAGGERQLVRLLTGREVPSGGHPHDLGIVVQNVGTAAAVARAVLDGEPLVTRLVSVTGAGVARPGTFEARIGTPIAELVAAAGGYTAQAARLVAGGPMMGVALPDDAIPVDKTTNCVLVLGHGDLAAAAPELPCIRCGECVRVCPASLLPQQLEWYARAGDFERVREHALFDCIECGLCAYACPSHIPLVAHFREAKREIRALDAARAAAVRARERHAARARRLEREVSEREARLAARTHEALAPAPPEDPVAAALARAQAKRRPVDAA